MVRAVKKRKGRDDRRRNGDSIRLSELTISTTAPFDLLSMKTHKGLAPPPHADPLCRATADMSTDFFSTDYVEARDRFRSAAAAADAATEELLLTARGPGGEELSIDIARIGSPDAENVLVHSSGLHGVEGFLGSALQLQLLSQPPRMPPNAAVIVIHVINPYGMAWIRRANENNVDLNRNFRAEGQFRGAPEMYHSLNQLLNPAGRPHVLDPFYLQAVWCFMRHGPVAPRQAVGEGQYEYARGLFFGGQRLEEGPRLLVDWIRRNLAAARRIVSIDVHSGLGPYGVDSLLIQYPAASERGQVLRRQFGEQAKLDHGTEVAYRINGGFLEHLEQVLPDAQWYAMTQEYGTFGVLKVLKALRDENRYHQYSPQVDVDHRTKRTLLGLFCPEDPAWRRTVLHRSNDLLRKATRLAFDSALQPAG